MFIHLGDPNACVGTELHPEDQKRVLASYVHRYTGDHTPYWATKPAHQDRPYRVQFSSDRDWLANTWFAVKRDGRLDRRYNHCHSRPTWPTGK